MSLTEKTLYEIHRLLKTKKIKVSEVVSACADIAEKNNHNAYIFVCKDQANELAQIYDLKIDESTSPLFGIPYSLKDLFITQGIRTTAGSKILYNYIPENDSFAAKKLKATQAIMIGKNSLDEFGMGSTSENTPFGPVLNPLNSQHLAGGSSGGSAAAVKEGSAFFSLGTDTGGSIRLPAHFCGVNAYKPSYGCISRQGQIAFASSLDQTSIIAKTVLDLAMVADELMTKDPHDSTNVDLGSFNLMRSLLHMDKNYLVGKRVGIFPDWMEGLEDYMGKAIEQLMNHLQKEGIEFVDIKLPYARYAISVYYIVATTEASSNLARYNGVFYGHRELHQKNLEETYCQTRSTGFHTEVKRRILLGTLTNEHYLKAARVRRLIQQDFFREFQNCDFILAPVGVRPPPKIDEMMETLEIYQNDFFSIPANLAGIPAMAIKTSRDWPPTGIQIMAPQFNDKELFEFSHALERSYFV